jgi:protein TonB
VNTLLSEFSRNGQPARADTSSRVGGGLLTALLYALFAVIAWRFSEGPIHMAKSEIVATLLPSVPTKRDLVPVPPPVTHLIRPRAEQPAPPVFTIASGPQQAPAPLPALAVKASPMLGGSSGNGPMGQAASGNGTGGNGAGLGACLDPAWMRAVTERVRQFFYYPDAALAVRTTGVAMVHFTVRRNGQIDRLDIGKSSGDKGLDKAAIDILRKAQPLPPIPDRMRVDRVDGDLPINFGVRNFNGGASQGNCRS